MLTSLSITNFALIDALEVNFNNGFSIITGETGAGKSILLGGLSLVLGKRADLSQIKDKSKKCVIEAIFDIANYDLKSIFIKDNLDYDPQTIIRREILPSGKSRAFVNDTPVNLDSLNHLSNHLLDIHSQHQTLQLVDDSYQFKVIDAIANNKSLLFDYKSELNTYKKLKQELTHLETSLVESKKEYDYNLFLLNELQEVQLDNINIETLESSYEQLSNVETINEVMSYSKSLLNNEELGVIERLNEIKRQLSNISSYGKQYASIEERIESVAIELNDILVELDDIDGELISDPQELEKINTKLQVINNLLQKHSVLEVSDLLDIMDSLTEKIDISENIDSNISEVEGQIEKSKTRLDTIASKLSKNRKAVVPKFISNLETILGQLGMVNAKFDIQLNSSETYKYNGKDQLQFLFKANKGVDFKDEDVSAACTNIEEIDIRG